MIAIDCWRSCYIPLDRLVPELPAAPPDRILFQVSAPRNLSSDTVPWVSCHWIHWQLDAVGFLGLTSQDLSEQPQRNQIPPIESTWCQAAHLLHLWALCLRREAQHIRKTDIWAGCQGQDGLFLSKRLSTNVSNQWLTCCTATIARGLSYSLDGLAAHSKVPKNGQRD